MKLFPKASVVHFAIPMSLLGLAFNVAHFETQLGWDFILPDALFGLGYAIFAYLLANYSVQWLLQRKHGAASYLVCEWHNPTQSTLFSVVTFCLLLIVNSLTYYHVSHNWVIFLYFVAVIAHTFIAFNLFARWIFDKNINLTHLQPTWFIVFSGNFYVVITGHFLLEGAMREILWFYFSYSLFALTVVMSLMFLRLFFKEKLAPSLKPSLFIFMAPPSLGTIATLFLYDASATVPLLVWLLFSFATLMLLLWAQSISLFLAEKTSIVSWAYIYPLAAYGLASQYLWDVNGHVIFGIIAVVTLFVVLIIVTLMLTWQVKQIIRA